MNDEFKSNTDRARDKSREPEIIETRQISGKAIKREKSKMRKFVDVFMPEDMTSVKSYIWDEIIVPTAKRMALDSLETFFDIKPSSRNRYRSSDGTSYRAYYDDDRRRDRYSDNGPRAASVARLDEFKLTLKDADDTMDYLRDILAHEHRVKVSDYYYYIRESCPYTLENYGWYDLRDVQIERQLDGYYVLKFPHPVLLRDDRR